MVSFLLLTLVACRSSPSDPAKLPSATEFVAKESELQKTVIDGPAERYLAAAKALRGAANALGEDLASNDSDRVLRGQIQFVKGMLASILPEKAGDPHVRQYMAQSIHERVTHLTLDPLPYPPIATLSQENADDAAAAEQPHGGADEAIAAFEADANAACACTDKACAVAAFAAFRRHGAMYADVTGSDADQQRVAAAQLRIKTCLARLPGST